jgi:hypothetical protein
MIKISIEARSSAARFKVAVVFPIDPESFFVG